MSTRVEWICCQPTPYNDVLFQALALDPAIDLRVHFTARVIPSHPWSSPLASGYLCRYYDRYWGLDWELIRYAGRTSSLIVSGGWNDPTILAVLARRIKNGGPYIIWTDTPRINGSGGMIRRLARGFAVRTILTRAEAVLGTGHSATIALTSLGAHPQKTHNLPYFVDLKTFRPNQHRSEHDTLVALSVGRVDFKLKGHDIAIAALARVRQKTGVPIKYRVAGSGSDTEALKGLASSTGVDLEVLGWLEPSQVPQFYSSGDCLIHPSLYEPYGVAILEAMASGMPVLASDVCGAAIDRIVTGENGFVHRVGAIDELAEQLAVFATERAELRRMGAAARRSAEQWPPDRGVRLLRELIREC